MAISCSPLLAVGIARSIGVVRGRRHSVPPALVGCGASAVLVNHLFDTGW